MKSLTSLQPSHTPASSFFLAFPRTVSSYAKFFPLFLAGFTSYLLVEALFTIDNQLIILFLPV
jgi:hypothetical protein